MPGWGRSNKPTAAGMRSDQSEASKVRRPMSVSHNDCWGPRAGRHIDIDDENEMTKCGMSLFLLGCLMDRDVAGHAEGLNRGRLHPLAISSPITVLVIKEQTVRACYLLSDPLGK